MVRVVEQIVVLVGVGVEVEQFARVTGAQVQLPAAAHDGPPGLRVAQVDLQASQVTVLDLADSVPLDDFATKVLGITESSVVWIRPLSTPTVPAGLAS